MDWIALLAGLAIVVGSYLGGWFAAHRYRARRNMAPSYTCTCTHPLSSHDPKTSKCHDKVYRSGWVACPCRQYQGERPFPELTPEDMFRNLGSKSDGA